MPKDLAEFPIIFGEDDLKYLEGSLFLEIISKTKESLKSDCAKICEIAPDFKEFSFKEYLRCYTLVKSRFFKIKLDGFENSPTTCLVPYGDMINHSDKPNTKWSYDNIMDGFVVNALADIPKGVEISIAYN